MKIKQTQKKASTIIQSQKGEEKQETSFSRIEENTPAQIIKPNFAPKLSGTLTTFVSNGFSDNKQMKIIKDETGKEDIFAEEYQIKDKNSKGIIYYGKPDPISSLSEETRRQFEQLVKNKVILSKDIDLFTKKLFHLYHIYAFKEWSSKGYDKISIHDIKATDLEIVIPKRDIIKAFNISKQYLQQNLTPAIYTLRYISIVDFTTKRKDKGYIITSGNDIKQLFTEFNTDKRGLASLTFSQKYAEYLYNYSYVQYPIDIFKCKNVVAFDILEFIYRYYYLNFDKKDFKTPFTITRRAIVENTKSLPTIKDIEKNYNRKYKERLYQPLENTLTYINDEYSTLLQIEPVFTDEEKQEQELYHIQELDKEVDKEQWLNRKLKVTLYDAPNYGKELSKNRKKNK